MQCAAKSLIQESSSDKDDKHSLSSDDNGQMDLDAEEQNIQSEIENLRQEKYREKKKIKKKERELAAK